MASEPADLAQRFRSLLRADAVCFWRVNAEGAAHPVCCAPADLQTEAFALPRMQSQPVEIERGSHAHELLPLYLRPRLLAMPGEPVALRCRASENSGFFAIWPDARQVPANVAELAGFLGEHWQQLSKGQKVNDDLASSLAQMHSLVFALPQGVILIPHDSRQGLVNPVAAAWMGIEQVGYCERVLLIDALSNFIDQADNKGELRDHFAPVLGGDQQAVTGCIANFSSRALALQLTLAPMVAGELQGWVWLMEDVSERRRMEEQVRQLAFYDPLTHLPNRRLLIDRLNQTLLASKRSASYGALMFLDLDNFKTLNDTQGHVAGDLLLAEVANRLASCVRETDTVARFGGDEFVVLLHELAADSQESKAKAGFIAEKIRLTLSWPYILHVEHEGAGAIKIEHRCTASIGVSLFIHGAASQDEILMRADLAMYQSKEGGKNRVQFYAEDKGVAL